MVGDLGTEVPDEAPAADGAFSVRHDVRPTAETVPPAEAPRAYARMTADEARFGIVLDLRAA